MGRKNKRRAQLDSVRKSKVSKVQPEEILEVPTPISPPTNPTPMVRLATTSRSTKKLSTATAVTDDIHPEPADTLRTVVDLVTIQGLVGKLGCPLCKNVSLSCRVDPKKHSGLVIKLSVWCEVCEEEVTRTPTSVRQPSKSFAVNDTAVASSLLSGNGPYSFNKFCEHSGMPGINPTTFAKKANLLYEKTEQLRDSIESKTASLVRSAYAPTAAATDHINVTVSYDGTWLTRGHKSLIGVGCVIDTLTGYVIDYHVMSTFCLTCEKTGKKKKVTLPAAEYEKWVEDHKPFCDINYTGSAGMMETYAAKKLWSRSVSKFGLRYTKVVSDGDSKAFNAVVELNPYGIDIVKEECVNHVGKRMGTSLRNLIATCRAQHITLGGKGYGRLTQQTISKLTTYYTRAIRKHDKVEDMRNAILATMYHGFSTDTRPMHHLCPVGQHSWCFYNAAVARNLQPPKHSKALRTPLNYAILGKHLKPVYQRLSSPELLKRCLLGTTQNANESLHSKIWSNCPKERFHSVRKVLFSVVVSISEFNFGVAGISLVKDILGVGSTLHSHRLGCNRQKKRIADSLAKRDIGFRNRLKQRKEAKARRELQYTQAEGSSYGFGKVCF